jgi:very-short-patch-repair endonuclease
MSIYQNIELYKELLFRANEMLLKPTRAEKALKEAILDRFPTSDFQFQVVMVPFIVDVVSIESKLIIEIDGSIHMYSFESDKKRQSDLEEDGYRFLRFSNDHVIKNIDSVLKQIDETMRTLPVSRVKKSKFYKIDKKLTRKTDGDPNLADPKVEKISTTRQHIPEILTGVIFDPYESIKLNEEDQKGDSSNQKFQCKKCKLIIRPNETRIAFRLNSEFIGWCHKKC